MYGVDESPPRVSQGAVQQQMKQTSCELLQELSQELTQELEVQYHHPEAQMNKTRLASATEGCTGCGKTYGTSATSVKGDNSLKHVGHGYLG